MNTTLRNTFAAIALASGAVMTLTATVNAQSAPPAAAAQPAAPQWLSVKQVYDAVEAAGYRDIREIERERKGYEVKATDEKGQAVKLKVDPVSGKVVSARERHDD